MRRGGRQRCDYGLVSTPTSVDGIQDNDTDGINLDCVFYLNPIKILTKRSRHLPP
jgi:hypothetical protein